jgi:hypothetical protein
MEAVPFQLENHDPTCFPYLRGNGLTILRFCFYIFNRILIKVTVFLIHLSFVFFFFSIKNSKLTEMVRIIINFKIFNPLRCLKLLKLHVFIHENE